MTDETTIGAAPPTIKTDVPDHLIPAMLPHPVTSGPPLANGTRYMHNFEVELVAWMGRLWSVASEEGKQALAWIKGEQDAHAQAIEDHKASTRAANEAANAAAANPPTNPPPDSE